ncbi:MAG: glycosyltransferase family 9 protein, partial [Selenomonas sp.]|nr:glycosyltransferase family 9 protein [Selenomonas sp.]
MKNFLIVKLSAIGDVIHALHVAYALKEAYPDCHITWVVEPPAYDFVNMSPYIDEIILFEKKKFKSLGGFLHEYGPLKRKIRQRRYDAVLDLQGLFKSAAIARLGKAPVKLGMCNMRELSDKISRPVIGPHAHGHIVERYLDVARALGCPVNEVRFTLNVPEREADLSQQIFAQAGANMANPYVVLAIGANWPNKRWPAENFAKLADWIYDKQLIPVMVGGGIVDEQRAAEISSYSDIPPLNLVGRTNFKQLTYILQNARLTIG